MYGSDLLFLLCVIITILLTQKPLPEAMCRCCTQNNNCSVLPQAQAVFFYVCVFSFDCCCIGKWPFSATVEWNRGACWFCMTVLYSHATVTNHSFEGSRCSMHALCVYLLKIHCVNIFVKRVMVRRVGFE